MIYLFLFILWVFRASNCWLSRVENGKLVRRLESVRNQNQNIADIEQVWAQSEVQSLKRQCHMYLLRELSFPMYFDDTPLYKVPMCINKAVFKMRVKVFNGHCFWLHWPSHNFFFDNFPLLSTMCINTVQDKYLHLWYNSCKILWRWWGNVGLGKE